ncbi:hypothetical protein C8F04DRAFT_957517 [Mycena alexandri]|uniref:BTB domain-containing protein n=1 Tax=Mycena alexandri TaxID=1745969 RepID=A0AAD6ST55_9AGAR|nr:hypothetical protein C8F04DRAFT_957517 [Mycena alexandri]
MNVPADGSSKLEAQVGDSEFTRAEGLWFQDCGLIIRAETTIFRVSRDFLATHSPVFADMLTLPAPDAADMMDGCPFVLLPDRAEDVTVFLKALVYYNFFEPYPAPPTLSILTGVLRMSHKYEVQELRKRALTHLSAFHPTTLSEYQALDGKSALWFTELTRDGFLPILVMARTLDIEWILPIAFYRICDFDLDRDILEADISLDDKVRCVTGSRILETAGVSKMVDFLWSPLTGLGCGSPMGCMTSRVKSRRSVEHRREQTAADMVTSPLTVWAEASWKRLDVCDLCLSSMKTAHHQAMQSLWDRLPEIFELPEWNELERLKAEALA